MGNRKGQFFAGALLAAVISSFVYCKKNNVKCNYSFSDLCSLFKRDAAAAVEPVVSTVETVVASVEPASN